jgi:hypothetical protein
MSAAMEQICTPRTRSRFQDGFDHDMYDDDGDFPYTEVQLAMPVEDFLAYRWDWKDLLVFLDGGTKSIMLWITEHAFLVVGPGNGYHFEDLNPGQDYYYVEASIENTTGKQQVLMLARLWPYETEKLRAETSIFLACSGDQQ